MRSGVFSGQATGPLPESRGVPSINQAGEGTEDPSPAIHHNLFSMTLLIVEAQHQLPVILGAAGDAVGADRTGAETGGSKCRSAQDDRAQHHDGQQ